MVLLARSDEMRRLSLSSGHSGEMRAQQAQVKRHFQSLALVTFIPHPCCPRLLG
jgi:hypothetical protein